MPFYLRTGKAMAEGRRTVTIGFTEAPLRIFPHQESDEALRPSELVFELSDDPEVRIEVQAKIPGPVIDLGRAALTLDVEQAFDGADGLEAYERLLHDVMLRERLLFTRSEQIERLWEVCAPVLEQPPEAQPYERAPGVREAALRARRRRRAGAYPTAPDRAAGPGRRRREQLVQRGEVVLARRPVAPPRRWRGPARAWSPRRSPIETTSRASRAPIATSVSRQFRSSGVALAAH